MGVSIKQRQLTGEEISKLVGETKFFPHLVYVSPSHWRRLARPYCLSVDGRFAGVCAIYRCCEWVKIGPLVVLGKYHRKGLGKTLLRHVVHNNGNVSLFLTSSNPSVRGIAGSLGFCEVPDIFSLPKNIVALLLIQSMRYIHIRLLTERIRKMLIHPRGKRKYYVKTA